MMDWTGDDQTHVNEYYDPEFARYHDLISLTRESTNNFDRISSDKNKHKINQVDNNDIIDADGNDETYLDSLIDYLYDQNVSEADILKLINYLKAEHYMRQRQLI